MPPTNRLRHRPLRPLLGWRVLGLGCALLVALLSLASASDLLHDHVHGHDHAHAHDSHHDSHHERDEPVAEHACAITLFAHGAENPSGQATFNVAPGERAVTTLRLAQVATPEIVDRPRRPGRDPPTGGHNA